jgi:co-chaperonin GroES (HSP10)
VDKARRPAYTDFKLSERRINDLSEERDETFVSPIVPEALPGRLIVTFAEPELTHGSIVLLRAQKPENVATVVKVGDGTDKPEEMFAKIVRPGDKVICKKHHGEEFEADGVTYYIFRMFQIIGKVPS